MNAALDLPPEQTSQKREGAARSRRQLKGDLDNIVLKALRKEPERRYASVEQLSEDIRRHLEGLPVAATPDSLPYRARKFVLRHKVGMAAIVAVVLAVFAGVTATVREARIADANARRAQERFNDVRKLANSLMFEIHDSIRDLPGSTPARRLLVTRALEYLDGLSRQSQGDPSLQKELAAAYERVGDVEGYPYAANLGDGPGALQSYRKAAAIRKALAAAYPLDIQIQSDLAANYFRMRDVNLDTYRVNARAVCGTPDDAALTARLTGTVRAPMLVVRNESHHDVVITVSSDSPVQPAPQVHGKVPQSTRVGAIGPRRRPATVPDLPVVLPGGDGHHADAPRATAWLPAAGHPAAPGIPAAARRPDRRPAHGARDDVRRDRPDRAARLRAGARLRLTRPPQR